MTNQEKQSGGRKMERLFEEVFVEVCAPTLCGIKPSNLFRYQPQNRDKLLEALDSGTGNWNRRGFRCGRLKSAAGRARF